MNPERPPRWKHACSVCGKTFTYGMEQGADPPLIPRHKRRDLPKFDCTGAGRAGVPRGIVRRPAVEP